MLKYSLFSLYVFFHTALCGCKQDHKRSGFELAKKIKHKKKTRIGKMDNTEVEESSGFALAEDGNLWTHGDAGTPSKLYKVSLQGTLLKTQETPVLLTKIGKILQKIKAGICTSAIWAIIATPGGIFVFIK